MLAPPIKIGIPIASIQRSTYIEITQKATGIADYFQPNLIKIREIFPIVLLEDGMDRVKPMGWSECDMGEESRETDVSSWSGRSGD